MDRVRIVSYGRLNNKDRQVTHLELINKPEPQGLIGDRFIGIQRDNAGWIETDNKEVGDTIANWLIQYLPEQTLSRIHHLLVERIYKGGTI